MIPISATLLTALFVYPLFSCPLATPNLSTPTLIFSHAYLLSTCKQDDLVFFDEHCDSTRTDLIPPLLCYAPAGTLLSTLASTMLLRGCVIFLSHFHRRRPDRQARLLFCFIFPFGSAPMLS
ncbi:hypothetical protein BO82DRAFT_50027 [Aspergillus uvarum CBS 121591]|uniref:Uncharacterized protein n=1 Tax=Aspergillus uvarum CBS 121591 TaxID=1448315 RepID=A0A319CVX5_9EURO|nr:hypothetical protein BO82DRAFT_50027 [Aspergillus uvarum CBS 121591]PYH83033.1 hypothetical protein BO82DRAFT_50027 [Aspergillus uvarum CBS 121591]